MGHLEAWPLLSPGSREKRGDPWETGAGPPRLHQESFASMKTQPSQVWGLDARGNGFLN